MADTTISPNMNLPIPTVSTDTGPDWANNLNSCLLAIDGHDHTPGSGVMLTPDSLNINASLPMNNNSLTATKSVVFQAQTSLATLDAIYVSGVDLYYNDGSGNVIRITQSGNVAGATGTITGLPSGTASASYQSVSGTFRFQSSTNTPANISGATVLIAEQVANPNFISLASPTSLASAYTVTFPASTPAATGIVQMDTSGALSNSLVVDNSTIEISSSILRVKDLGITAAKIANLTITGAQIANGTITTTQISASANIPGSKLTPTLEIGGGSAISPAATTYQTAANNRAFVLSELTSSSGGVRILKGVIAANGSIVTGEGFSVVNGSTGSYTVTFSAGFALAPTVIVSNADTSAFAFIRTSAISTTACTVLTASTTPVANNMAFCILIVGSI